MMAAWKRFRVPETLHDCVIQGHVRDGRETIRDEGQTKRNDIAHFQMVALPEFSQLDTVVKGYSVVGGSGGFGDNKLFKTG